MPAAFVMFDHGCEFLGTAGDGSASGVVLRRRLIAHVRDVRHRPIAGFNVVMPATTRRFDLGAQEWHLLGEGAVRPARFEPEAAKRLDQIVDGPGLAFGSRGRLACRCCRRFDFGHRG
jgi:hypothetical protein